MITHQILPNDTLESLASRYYQDARRWRAIALANDLRAPYISRNPLDQYGDVLQSYPLVQVAPSSATRVVASGMDTSIVRSGARVVLQRRGTDGVLVRDVCEVRSASATAINFTSKLQNRYPVGTALEVYPPALELRGRVMRPGDTLTIPDDGTLVASTTPALVLGETDADRLYGRDLETDRNGNLVMTESGDISITTGDDNIGQQIRHRIRTPVGALPRHPSYGCLINNGPVDLLNPTYLGHIRAWVVLALKQDPRVSQVTFTSVRQQDDMVFLACQVIAQRTKFLFDIEVDHAVV